MNDADERELVRRSLDRQARAREFRMADLPGYMAWSSRKLADGASPAHIAHLDATTAWLLPEEAASQTDEDYDELLDELVEDLEGGAPDDREITERVTSLLYAQHPVLSLPTAIGVRTLDGVVHLTGRVASAAERDLAESVARQARGVKRVESSIAVVSKVR